MPFNVWHNQVRPPCCVHIIKDILTSHSDDYNHEALCLINRINYACFRAIKAFRRRRDPSSQLKVGPTQDPLQVPVVAGIVHYSNGLISLALQASTKFQVVGLNSVQLNKFLQPLECWERPRKLVHDLDAQLDTPLSPGSLDISKPYLCAECNRLPLDGCYWSHTRDGPRVWHKTCVQCKACGRAGYGQEEGEKRTDASGKLVMKCKFCSVAPDEGTYDMLSKLDTDFFHLHAVLTKQIMDTCQFRQST
jgi:hypothetical protein